MEKWNSRSSAETLAMAFFCELQEALQKNEEEEEEERRPKKKTTTK